MGVPDTKLDLYLLAAAFFMPVMLGLILGDLLDRIAEPFLLLVPDPRDFEDLGRL